MEMKLTERELELLLLIKSIWEFDAENPGNIPEGGIGEIAVSNGIYEPDEYKECLQELRRLKLVDGDEKITEAGTNYLITLYAEVEKFCKEKNNIDKHILEQLRQAMEMIEKHKNAKITLSQMLDYVMKITTIIHNVLASAEICRTLYKFIETLS